MKSAGLGRVRTVATGDLPRAKLRPPWVVTVSIASAFFWALPAMCGLYPTLVQRLCWRGQGPMEWGPYWLKRDIKRAHPGSVQRNALARLTVYTDE